MLGYRSIESIHILLPYVFVLEVGLGHCFCGILGVQAITALPAALAVHKQTLESQETFGLITLSKTTQNPILSMFVPL